MNAFEEARRIANRMPTDLSKEEIDTIRSRGLLSSEALVYKIVWCTDPLTGLKARKAAVTCTACGETFHTDYLSGNPAACSRGRQHSRFYNWLFKEYVECYSDTICPNCGHTARAYHTDAIGSGAFAICATNCLKLDVVDGHFVMMEWIITKYIDRMAHVYFTARKSEAVILLENKLYRAAGSKNNFGTILEFGRWEIRKKFEDRIAGIHPCAVLDYDEGVVHIESVDHAAMEDYLTSGEFVYPCGYLRMWLKHPNAENLVRTGYGEYVSAVIDICTSQRYSYYTAYQTYNAEKEKTYIDWKKVKPHDMLALEKSEYRRLRGKSLSDIETFKWGKEKHGIPFEDKHLTMIREIGEDKNSLEDFFGNHHYGYRPNVIRTIQYLHREKAAAYNKTLIRLSYLRDYWNALFKVNGQLDAALLYPKDLVQAHNNAVERVKEKEDRELSAKIRERYEAAIENAYEDEESGLLIRHVATHGELIIEGKTLHHCVGSYAKSVAAGRTSIYLIRKITEPDVPYFTLEYRNGKVIQNRGIHNCDPPEDVVLFQKKWLKYIGGQKHAKRIGA